MPAPIKQFLPFGLAGGAYVLSAAAYAALPARLSGYPAGLLPKESLNSAVRQGSFVAAALSQWASDTGGLDTLDDGNIANWIAAYVAAFNVQAGAVLTGTFKVYAGNPNTHVAGVQGNPVGPIFPSVVWDITNNIWWVCTTTGNAAAAVWSQAIGSGNAAYWCGTSAGTNVVQVVAPPASLTAVVTGTAIAWKVGPALTNPGAASITVTGLGTFAIRKDGPAGPVPLTGGELVAGNIVMTRYDGAFMQLVATEMGSAALADASANTGIVAAVSGAVVVGNIPAFNDVLGTIVDSGASVGSLTGSAEAIMYQLGYSF